MQESEMDRRAGRRRGATTSSAAWNGEAPAAADAAEEIAPRPVRRRRTRLALLATLCSLAVFGILAWSVATGRTTGADLALTLGIQRLNLPLLTALMELVSLFGYPPFNAVTVGAVAVVLFANGRRLEAAFAVAAALGAGTLSTLAKLIWLRPRPTADAVLVLGTSAGYSFPSGHVVFYVAFFGFLLYWCYAALRPGPARATLVGILGGLIALVGPSRVYLGQHWASDALGGYALGLLYLLLLIRLHSALALERPALNAGPAPKRGGAKARPGGD